MKKLMCPSMMCADFGNLEKEVQLLDEAGIDIFHLDIMDGTFVPNFGMGLQDVEYIIKNSKARCDVHLMIQNPGNHIEKFIDYGADIVYIHPESDRDPVRTLNKIKELGAEAGIAINPGTSLESVKELFSLVDKVMVMTVSPGFAGQKYLDFVDFKIDDLMKFSDTFKFEVFVDGAISPERIKTLSNKGVKGFVLGTSSLFGKEDSYKNIISELNNI